MKKTYAEIEGTILEDGGWRANDGSIFRSLTRQEVLELQEMAEKTIPIFGGDGNAIWEQHHPIARDIWQKRGFKSEV